VYLIYYPGYNRKENLLGELLNMATSLREPEQTLLALDTIWKSLMYQIREGIIDNEVTTVKALMTTAVSNLGTLNTSIQASTNFNNLP